MKRSNLQRKAPLKRATAGLSRSKPLGRGNVPLRRSRRQTAIVGLSLNTARIAWIRTDGRCACGCGAPIAPFPIGYHHVYPKAKYPRLIDDPANIVGVAENCHANHETAARRLPRHVTDLALELCATTEAMVDYLARTYR